MHDGERTRGIDRVADGGEIREADGMIDRILRRVRPPPSATTATPTWRVAMLCTMPERSA